MAKFNLKALQEAVGGQTAAFRTYVRMQPAGGAGTKVFPPTYSGGVYAWEQRRINGEEVPCVLLDAVQSQANRLEEALRVAWEEERLKMPLVLTDFSAVELPKDVTDIVKKSVHGIGEITTLDAPHRVADAIMRDSVTKDGTDFRTAYEAVFDANMSNATALGRFARPRWCSGRGTPRGVAADWETSSPAPSLGNRRHQRRRRSRNLQPDRPVGNHRPKVPIYASKDGGWTAIEAEAETTGTGKKLEAVLYKSKSGKGKPSAVNHSNVTPDIVTAERSDEAIGGGVTLDFALLNIGSLAPGSAAVTVP